MPMLISTKNRSLIVDCIALLFILVFVYASLSKLGDYQKFLSQLGQSEILSAYSMQFSIVIPSFELLICALLFFNRTKLLGLYGSFGIMVLFTLYIGSILVLTEDIPCACGGILEMLSWEAHIWFNMGLIVLAMIGVLLYRSDVF
ncbi:MauE/DoxX family redox-associated membrane protein [Chitinophaga sp. CB10]|uniref:MauE/DoxX family redox-associated membrane protein n=1 Tax=Chitinophaga sp. CB10 TaxID=1891659 RepID=UPI0025C584B7|nr:MauE/DoxX family redox-associated membrane protein [Chitinophaga sp. CB10]